VIGPWLPLERNASGCPVIGTRVPGLADLIDSGRTGILMPPEEPGELAQALREIFAWPELSVQLGRNGRGMVREYDWSRVARRHLALYGELLAERGLSELASNP